MLTIKRYPNRKFYNSETRRYITLDGIASLIRQGREVQVIDHASGEDLTSLVLTQVILEQEKQQSGFMPRSVLTGLVQASGYTLARMRQALASPADWLRQVDEEIDRRIELLLQRGELTESEAASLRQKLLTPAEPDLEEAAFRSLLAGQDLPSRQELEALNRQLDTLLEELSAIEANSGEQAPVLSPDDPPGKPADKTTVETTVKTA
jgi:polyhydroxyalkanoate synthesis repressor PhaR